MSEGFLDSEYVRNEFTRGAYSQREMAQEFDRWLDQVKADAWDEALEASVAEGWNPAHNPYRK